MPHRRIELGLKGPVLWYLVGLIATDGCLSSDGRHIDITAKDRDFLVGLVRLCGLRNKVTEKRGFGDKISHHIQFSNRTFYDFLLSIGLMQRKSKTLKEVVVDDAFFVDFLRGVIDGDGGMRRWVHPTNGGEQWHLRIVSGSGDFVLWLQKEIARRLGCAGRTYKGRRGVYCLKYGKMAAREIVRRCYYKDCFALARKKRLAEMCLLSSWGWRRSKLVAF